MFRAASKKRIRTSDVVQPLQPDGFQGEETEELSQQLKGDDLQACQRQSALHQGLHGSKEQGFVEDQQRADKLHGCEQHNGSKDQYRKMPLWTESGLKAFSVKRNGDMKLHLICQLHANPDGRRCCDEDSVLGTASMIGDADVVTTTSLPNHLDDDSGSIDDGKFPTTTTRTTNATTTTTTTATTNTTMATATSATNILPSTSRTSTATCRSISNANDNMDEYSVFGEYVARILRKLPTQAEQAITKHFVSEVLRDAELGKFNPK